MKVTWEMRLVLRTDLHSSWSINWCQEWRACTRTLHTVRDLVAQCRSYCILSKHVRLNSSVSPLQLSNQIPLWSLFSKPSFLQAPEFNWDLTGHCLPSTQSTQTKPDRSVSWIPEWCGQLHSFSSSKARQKEVKTHPIRLSRKVLAKERTVHGSSAYDKALE
jgi:hypothetical protein